MLYVITYDIADDERRTAVSEWLGGWGTRVQLSVFECHLDEAQFQKVREGIVSRVDEVCDRIRYYRVCGFDRPRITVQGQGQATLDVAFWVY